jgi:hypothetical protein
MLPNIDVSEPESNIEKIRTNAPTTRTTIIIKLGLDKIL